MPENKLLDLLPKQRKQAQCSVSKIQEYSDKDLLLPAAILHPAVELCAVNLGSVVLFISTVFR